MAHSRFRGAYLSRGQHLKSNEHSLGLRHPSVWLMGPPLTFGLLLLMVLFLRGQRQIGRPRVFTLSWTNAITSAKPCTAQIWRAPTPRGPWTKYRCIEGFTNSFAVLCTNEGEAQFYKVCP